MPDTVSNHKKDIVTSGTSHVAKTDGAKDELLDQADGIWAAFPNEVPASRLQNGTVRTMIHGCSILTTSGQLGPLSDDDFTPFTYGLHNGGLCRQEAKVIIGSSDLYAEGAQAGRTGDATGQNHRNCSGYIDGSQLSASELVEKTYLDHMCTIVRLDGINVVEVPSGGWQLFGWQSAPQTASRPLGWPGQEDLTQQPFYLEILSGSTVTFTATREDTTVVRQTPAGPQMVPTPANCWQRLHTSFRATRTGGAGTEEVIMNSVDEFVVDEGLTNITFNPVTATLEVLPIPPIGSIAYKNPTLPADAPIGAPAQASDDKMTLQASGLLSSIDAFIADIKYQNNPVIITVDAAACTGSKQAQLKVFPSQAVDVSFSFGAEMGGQTPGNDFIGKIFNTLANAQRILDLVQKIADLAGKEFEYQFLVGFTFGAKCAYLPCTQTCTGLFGRKVAPWHVGLAWSITLGATPLIGFKTEITMPVLNFLGPIGAAVSTALDWLGIKAEIGVSASIGVNLLISIGMDQHELPSATGGTIELTPTLAAFIRFQAGSIDIFKVEVSFPGSVALSILLSDKPGVMIQGIFSASLRMVVTVEVYIGPLVEICPPPWEPDWAKISAETGRFDIW